MALDFDDRILGEKVHNYCDSSDEDEGAPRGGRDHYNDTAGSDSNEEEAGAESAAGKAGGAESGASGTTYASRHAVRSAANQPLNRPRHAANHSNTGPKGVLEDYQQYRLLEALRREEEAIQLMLYAKNTALTCNSIAEDERLAKLEAKRSLEKRERSTGNKNKDYDPEEEEDEKEDWEKEIDALIQGTEEEEKDAFMQQYRQQRYMQMLALSERPLFGKVYELDISNFLENIDNEPKSVHVIVHIYEPNSKACDAMIGCFLNLCVDYPHVKFCQVLASQCNLSMQFSKFGVPALILFKGGQQIKNTVALRRQLGDDFFASDLERYLIVNGFIPRPGEPADGQTDKQSTTIRCTTNNDSDYDID